MFVLLGCSFGDANGVMALYERLWFALPGKSANIRKMQANVGSCRMNGAAMHACMAGVIWRIWCTAEAPQSRDSTDGQSAEFARARSRNCDSSRSSRRGASMSTRYAAVAGALSASSTAAATKPDRRRARCSYGFSQSMVSAPIDCGSSNLLRSSCILVPPSRRTDLPRNPSLSYSVTRAFGPTITLSALGFQ